MAWYTRIKKFYIAELWTKSMVADGVVFGKITAEQYTEITGEAYTPVSE
ncbi:MAG: XkdX family protein [Gorillibacterium sp.]|nr:XkdX family protein [Gorillibacterium sp.]